MWPRARTAHSAAIRLPSCTGRNPWCRATRRSSRIRWRTHWPSSRNAGRMRRRSRFGSQRSTEASSRWITWRRSRSVRRRAACWPTRSRFRTPAWRALSCRACVGWISPPLSADLVVGPSGRSAHRRASPAADRRCSSRRRAAPARHRARRCSSPRGLPRHPGRLRADRLGLASHAGRDPRRDRPRSAPRAPIALTRRGAGTAWRTASMSPQASPPNSPSMVLHTHGTARCRPAPRIQANGATTGDPSRRRTPVPGRDASRRIRSIEEVFAGFVLDVAGSPRSGAGGRPVTRADRASREGRAGHTSGQRGAGRVRARRARTPPPPSNSPRSCAPVVGRAISRRIRKIEEVFAGFVLDIAGSPLSGAAGRCACPRIRRWRRALRIRR